MVSFQLARPYMSGLGVKASKALRKKLSAKQKKSKKPLVRRTVNKKSGKVQVCPVLNHIVDSIHAWIYSHNFAALYVWKNIIMGSITDWPAKERRRRTKGVTGVSCTLWHYHGSPAQEIHRPCLSRQNVHLKGG